MFRDKDYVVKDDEVLIVDEFTGRIMNGRRYSDGLHQAIEAKEHVQVKRESRTLATVPSRTSSTSSRRRAGMTGTAKDRGKGVSKHLFHGRYSDSPPTDRYRELIWMMRYISLRREKFQAVVDEIQAIHETGAPALRGYHCHRNIELLSSMLRKRGIKHNVLNAKFHEQGRLS